MADIEYSQLLPEVLPYLRADPSDPVTENAIKRTVIEFCSSTLVWKHTPDPINVVAGTSAYTIAAPTDSVVAAVLSAQIDGQPIDPKSLDWLDSNVPRWRTQAATPEYFTQTEPQQLILAPLPSSTLASGLTLTVGLQPSQSAVGFPQWIFDQFLYVLADGAISKLMLMSDKPWTDMQNGADRRARFESATSGARTSADSSLGRATSRVTAQH